MTHPWQARYWPGATVWFRGVMHPEGRFQYQAMGEGDRRRLLMAGVEPIKAKDADIPPGSEVYGWGKLLAWEPELKVSAYELGRVNAQHEAETRAFWKQAQNKEP